VRGGDGSGGLRAWIVRCCQLVTGAIFALAALSKLGDLHSFAAEIHNFRIVPIATENLLAITLPWIELVAALALLLGIRARAGAVLASWLLVAFTVAVASAVARGLDFECGCFGTADGAHVGTRKLVENLAMTLFAVVGALRRR